VATGGHRWIGSNTLCCVGSTFRVDTYYGLGTLQLIMMTWVVCPRRDILNICKRKINIAVPNDGLELKLRCLPSWADLAVAHMVEFGLVCGLQLAAVGAGT
jgi:hypothetical protein